MICLSDSDLVIKLAEFDLLDETLQVLGVARADVRVLRELSYLLRSDRLFAKHSRSAVQRAVKFVNGIKTIEQIDRGEQILLQDVKATYRTQTIKIDTGEALIYSATKFLTDYVVASGDKRSMRALASSADCSAIHARLCGHVICLEQIVLKLIDVHGYKLVQERVAPQCACDKCIQDAFANGKPSFPEKDCRVWLDGYVSELRTETRGLLVA